MSDSVKHVSVRIPADIHEQVTASATEDLRSLNSQIVSLLRDGLKARTAASRK